MTSQTIDQYHITNCFSKILEIILFKYLHNYIRDTDICWLIISLDSEMMTLLLYNPHLIIYDETVKNLDQVYILWHLKSVPSSFV